MKSKIFLLAITLLVLATYSCKKEDQLEADIKKIEAYLAENNIEALRHSSGLFYVIETAGGAQKPGPNATVTVSYKGMLLNGTIFDQNQYVNLDLPTLIEGWKIGIPLIGAGGKIKLFVPSTLAYGKTDRDGIPANSVLIFEISLHYF